MAEKRTIGLMDPNYYAFIVTIEKLIANVCKKVEYKGKTYDIATKRMKCKPYDVLDAWTETSVIMNRGAHWNRHRGSFFEIVGWKSHLIYNMFSFKAIDKNAGYGMMHELGLKVPATWAIPQKDYSKMFENTESNMQIDLLFEDHEMFDLEKIGEAVGYPAYLKPQDGGGWVGVTKVNDYEELRQAYDKSEDKPMNLQKAVVGYKEFCRSVGVGPQVMPMHYNASAKYSHDRYLRNENQAVEFNFLSEKEEAEINKITKIINAFYGWDHNSCESLLTESGDTYIIDYINAYPDSSLTSLHFYFPGLVKAMAKWLIFCAVVGRPEGYDFMKNWPKFYAVKEEGKKKNWSYEKLLDEYEKIADEYWQKDEFEKFCKESLKDFDEKALEFFTSEEFDAVLNEDVSRFFRVKEERPAKYAHYKGILDFWAHCEREKLNPPKPAVKQESSKAEPEPAKSVKAPVKPAKKIEPAKVALKTDDKKVTEVKLPVKQESPKVAEVKLPAKQEATKAPETKLDLKVNAKKI